MTTLIQRALAGGEIAPTLYARTDQAKYQTGARTLRNFIILRHGGAANRSGTYLVAEVKDSSLRARLIKFVFNATQTYMFEFGNHYIRFMKLGAQMIVTDADAPAYNGATAYLPGTLVKSGGVYYMCIANTTGNAPPNAAFWYLQPANILEIPTTYNTADLQDLHYVQSGDVITITHPTYPPRDLSRLGEKNWKIADCVFAPSNAAPTGLGGAGTAGGTTQTYVVTSVKTDTLEESLPSIPLAVAAVAAPAAGTPVNLTWIAAPDTVQYNVYKLINGVYGFIGVAGLLAFSDIGYIPNAADSPPITRNPFAAPGDYPSTCGYYQQRLIFGNTNNNPETVYGGRSANFKNFTISVPLQSDDAVTFTLAGRQVNAIRSLADLKFLVVLTQGGEWAILGDTAGVVRPGQINPSKQSYNGSANLMPIFIDASLLYVQARKAIVRSLNFDANASNYQGDDLTLFASHLFNNRLITDWDYAQIPNSLVWAVTDLGELRSMTYIQAQQMFGWTRHDTASGLFENICCIPENNEDYAYFIVNRTIGGVTRRYIERMMSRLITDNVADPFFVDSGLTYDGRNATATTLLLTGGVTWNNQENLNLFASTAIFTALMVNEDNFVLNTNSESLRLRVIAYIDPQNITVRSVKTVPVGLRGAAFADWSRAIRNPTGIGHLEGETISILADGFVIANGTDAPLFTVVAGAIFPKLDQPYSVIHAGLPIVADLETLDIDNLNGQTLLNKASVISEVDLLVESSRGIFAGQDFDNLQEAKQRNEEGYEDPITPKTGLVRISCQSTYKYGGRVAVRQIDPLPLTILGVMPVGLIGG